MNALQKSLFINAVFSGSTGLISIIFKTHIATIFNVNSTTPFLILGIVLVYFSLTIVYAIVKQNALGVLFIIIQDYLWVLGSIIIVAFKLLDIASVGYVIIVVIAVLVLLMGINQSYALAKTDELHHPGEKQLYFEKHIKSNKEKVWQVISDVGNYHKIAPNIDKVNIISGKGEGMVRSCSHGKDTWTETCTLWIEGTVFAFSVDTTPVDYPYPFKMLYGRWEVEETGSADCKIEMTFTFRYKKSYQRWLLHPILKYKFTKIVQKLLENWQKEIQNN